MSRNSLDSLPMSGDEENHQQHDDGEMRHPSTSPTLDTDDDGEDDPRTTIRSRNRKKKKISHSDEDEDEDDGQIDDTEMYIDGIERKEPPRSSSRRPPSYGSVPLASMTSSIEGHAYGRSSGSIGKGLGKRGSQLVAKTRTMELENKIDPLTSNTMKRATETIEISEDDDDEQIDGDADENETKKPLTRDLISQKLAARNAALTRKKQQAVSDDDDDDEYESKESFIDIDEEDESSPIEESPEWNDDDAEDEDEEKSSESAYSSDESDDAPRKRRSTRSTKQSRRKIDADVDDDKDDEEEYGPTKSRSRLKKASSSSTNKKSTATRTPASTAASLSATASKSTRSMTSFFSKSTAADVSAQAAHAARVTAELEKHRAQVKKSRGNISSVSEDPDDDEVDHPYDDPSVNSAPSRTHTRPSRACTLKKPTPEPTPVPPPPTTGRRSARQHAVVSYKEKGETEGLEERTPTPPPKRRGKQKIIVEEEDDDEEEEEEEDVDDLEQSFFDSDDDKPVQAAAQAHFNARFANSRSSKIDSARSKRVVVESSKNNRKKGKGRSNVRRKRGSSEDDDDDSSDPEESRRAERAWTKDQGLLLTDAEDSDSDESVIEEENPIDKILAKRQIRIPSDPTRPDESEIIYRTEYFCKYKELSYHHCDWIDLKTIESWKNGKGRITAWHKREDDNLRCFVNDKRLFQQIRADEIKTYNRDEIEGTNALIQQEASRINKKFHPDLKTIEKVWAPKYHDTAADGADDFGVDDDGTVDDVSNLRSVLFDPTFLEVERIIGERDEEMEDGKIKKQYLIKWLNQPYCHVTWEDYETAKDDFIFQDHIDRFKRSLEFPTDFQLRTGRTYVADDVRPKLEVFHATKLPPPFLGGKQLKDYQLDGVNWMNTNFYQKKNCILADEMGLGKTVQTIAHLRTLVSKGLRGPFLVIAPLSTLAHWQREFESWTDEIIVVKYSDNEKSRDTINTYELQWSQAMGCATPAELKRLKSPIMRDIIRPNVIITSYDTFRQDIDFFRRITWQVLVADEAHIVRNQASKTYQCLQECEFIHKLFLTGTPIQNKLGELFTLLHMIDPLKFDSREEFESKYADLQKSGGVEEVSELHKAILPYFFRRMKSDVEKNLPKREETLIEVQLTTAQKQYYRAVFENNLEFLRGSDKKTLNNIAMQLRKVCNHPYMISGVEEKDSSELHLVTHDQHMERLLALSGKFILIDKLLKKLHSQGQKVLIFSQFVLTLDLLEDYLNWRGWKHERLDGSTAARSRQMAIDRFSKPGSDRFVFLLSTRAGGVGITLTAAQTVIIFDSDWNPQQDVQAIARAHRIGQQKTVQVYRLVTSSTYEAEMFEKSSMKLGLDQAVLHTMDRDKSAKELDKKEIEGLLRRGATYLLKDNDVAAKQFCEADIDTILQTNARTITTESTPTGTVGATSARSGLGQFTIASFSASSGEGSSVDVSDPDFWEKVAASSGMDESIKAKKKLAAEKKRTHKQLYDLSRPEGRAARDDHHGHGFHGRDWEGVADSDSEAEYDSDTFERKPKKKKLRLNTVSSLDAEIDVAYSSPDEDEIDKYYSGDFSKRQAIRFFEALQNYGYDRLDQLRPYFPNKSKDALQRLAIGYIIKLHELSNHKGKPLANVLVGTIRHDLIRILQQHHEAKHADSKLASSSTNNTDDSSTKSSHTTSRYENKLWKELFETFSKEKLKEPLLNDPKMTTSPHMFQPKRILAELNRLSVLYHVLHPKPKVKSEDGKKGDGDDVTIVSSHVAPPVPNASEIDTTKYVYLSHHLPSSASLPPMDSLISDAPPEKWWSPAIHDPALLLGVYSLGFSYQVSKERNIWEMVRMLPGLPFFGMSFSKPKRKSRKGGADGDGQDKDVDMNEDSRDNADNTATTTTTAEPATVDGASSATSIDVEMTHSIIGEEVITQSKSNGEDTQMTDVITTTTTATTSSTLESEAEANIWPNTNKLKSRFTHLIDALEKLQKSHLPSTDDYKPKKATLSTLLPGNKPKMPISSSSSSSSSSSTKLELSSDIDLPESQWKLLHVKAVIANLRAFGRPTNQLVLLQKRFFVAPTPSSTDETKIEKKEQDSSTTAIDEEKSRLTSNVSNADGDKFISIDSKSSIDHVSDSTSSKPGSVTGLHSFHDDWRHFLSQCSIKSQSYTSKQVETLVNKIIATMKLLKSAPKEEKEDKKKKTDDSVESILAAELSKQKAVKYLGEIEMAEELKRIVLHDGVRLHELLSSTNFKPVPFPSFQSQVDDESLIVGTIKHGHKKWDAMREDALLTLFKGLQPEAPKAKADKDKEKNEKKEANDTDTSATNTTTAVSEATADAASSNGTDDANAAAAESNSKKKDAKPKSTTVHYDYNEKALLERLKNMISWFKHTSSGSSTSAHPPAAAKALPTPAPSTPKKQISSSSSISTISPVKKEHQHTLGPSFGVPDEKISSPTPQKSPFKRPPVPFDSKPKDLTKLVQDSPKPKLKTSGALASLQSPLKQSQLQSSPIKSISSITTKSKPSRSNVIPMDIEDIDDDELFDSPPPGRPIPSSTSISSIASSVPSTSRSLPASSSKRPRSPIRAPTQLPTPPSASSNSWTESPEDLITPSPPAPISSSSSSSNVIGTPVTKKSKSNDGSAIATSKASVNSKDQHKSSESSKLKLTTSTSSSTSASKPTPMSSRSIARRLPVPSANDNAPPSTGDIEQSSRRSTAQPSGSLTSTQTNDDLTTSLTIHENETQTESSIPTQIVRVHLDTPA